MSVGMNEEEQTNKSLILKLSGNRNWHLKHNLVEDLMECLGWIPVVMSHFSVSPSLLLCLNQGAHPSVLKYEPPTHISLPHRAQQTDSKEGRADPTVQR